MPHTYTKNHHVVFGYEAAAEAYFQSNRPRLWANSSRWLSNQAPKFSWQQGYRACSVSAPILPEVIEYIRNQEAHHRKRSFDLEFAALLKKRGMDSDPRDVI